MLKLSSAPIKHSFCYSIELEEMTSTRIGWFCSVIVLASVSCSVLIFGNRKIKDLLNFKLENTGMSDRNTHLGISVNQMLLNETKGMDDPSVHCCFHDAAEETMDFLNTALILMPPLLCLPLLNM